MEGKNLKYKIVKELTYLYVLWQLCWYHRQTEKINLYMIYTVFRNKICTFCPICVRWLNKIMKIAIFSQCPDWPLLDETQWHWHWHPQIRMDTLFNWTDVISIQAERTTKKLDNIALCAHSLCFLPEELLYYNQSSSNEKFLARACFQDILCIHWHHQSCELGEKKLQRGSKVVRIIFFIFVCYK